MKSFFTSFAAGAMLIGTLVPGHAEDAVAPTPPAAPATTQSDAPPSSVPRPSLAPKPAEPAAAPVVNNAEPSSKTVSDDRPRRRRHAWRYNRRYSYWEPFPIYWPHVYHHRIRWNRIPWIFRF